ncbi:hypothetical protein Nepgr_027725 [Nepenthes gracilis]|uniref:Uncharacterized protein n=1 Tax=Nepenthes gracilis TaxID=150966 RepID=A0AAD3TAK8_NEPGR|nr:hypothetical protein Nepgr_027725 [Nepenthes gracilis]
MYAGHRSSAFPFGTKGFGEVQRKPDTGNIEEAESSLRESDCLSYEGARALLGRLEYQKGNVEAALHVFEGIDIGAITPKIKLTLSIRGRRRSSRDDDTPPMSMLDASRMLDAIFLKAKSLQTLGKFEEAAQSCKVILDIVESSLPDGLPENFGADCKLQETLINAVELLPELWKLAECPHEAILSYRRALLHHWNLDAETISKIQKEFALYLLYSGGEVILPDLRFQLDTAFVPKNNLEEAILLLMILYRKINLKIIKWDPSILDHLSFALCVSGQPRALASLVEELLPGIIDRKERYYSLALCYYGDGDSFSALNLLRKLLASREDPNNVPALLMASKVCPDHCQFTEGIGYAQRALEKMEEGCTEMVGIANDLLGLSLAELAKSVSANSERVARQSEAVQALERAGNLTEYRDTTIVYHLSLEYAEQRKLDSALYYAKKLVKLEGGSNVKGWILLARILSAQKRFADAETIVDAAINETGEWDRGELLRTKAKLQIAQDHLGNAIKTYSQLLAVFQVQSKSFGSGKNLLKGIGNYDRHLELETWHDLAYIYIRLSRWQDVDICLSKSKAINPQAASRWHVIGKVNEAKGRYKEALEVYTVALDIDPAHVPSLISLAEVLSRLSPRSHSVIRSFLMDVLRLDRTNHFAWRNLGRLYKEEGGASSSEAADCFRAACFLEETAPVEPFR